MVDELLAVADGEEIGRIERRSGRLTFTYADSWRQSPGSYPLSLSMPLHLAEHAHARIEAFLWGLLPDNPRVLENWGSRFQVSARNPFALIARVGEDCAGAVQFVRPERLGRMRTEPASAEITWLSEDDIAQRLQDLKQDHSAWRLARDTGQFSLAGAQPKTALLFRDGRWGVPSGRTPTTHILKPPTGEWDGHAENEHFCLELASAAGCIAATTQVQRFKEEVAIVIERYDRYVAGASLMRRHQEDMCQALGLPPSAKYQSEGGPSMRDIGGLLATSSSAGMEDARRFIQAVAFNWLIAGTDAHAKNYSILIGARGAVRFAPLYDVASILPYPNIYVPKLKMAMKIGGHYHLRMIGLRQWQRVAAEVRIDQDEMIAGLRAMAAQLPDQIAAVKRRIDRELKHPILRRLAQALTARAKECAETLQ
jgi:serine/threonine-protein kinase HipA